MDKKFNGKLTFSLGWLALVFAFFFTITWIDYVVNCILYRHGLSFCWEWYRLYQIGLSAVMLSMCGLVFWMSLREGRVTALKRGLTVGLANVGGLVDWIFFLVYNGGVAEGEWTWMPQYGWFGTWNWQLQAIWSLLFFVVIVVMWIGLSLLE